ncbi:MAG TPA: GNAT family N-acetyltransferase [Anaerolineaceae bacterium]|nr:GNAT family N-acetyltransferase [Anaerolineaceae bacterium]
MTEITLRNVIPADLPVFFEHQRDPVAYRMAAYPSKEREAFMAHWTKILAGEANVIRTILVDGQVAGNMLSFLMEGKREVGYWIGREYWGKGVATAALRQFLDVVTERPLYAYVVQHNAGSRRVLEKCGFQLLRETGEEVILKLNGDQGPSGPAESPA